MGRGSVAAMTTKPAGDEWAVIERLLPEGWCEQARVTGAFRRARYIRDPATLLRLLLLHAANDRGLRETTAKAGAAGLAKLSPVALFLRLRTSAPWLAWIAAGLARAMRADASTPLGRRLRAVDSTTIQGPASTTSGWRLHYSLDLSELACDWCALTDGRGAEAFERIPVMPGDVLVADRAFFRTPGVRHVVEAGGDLVARLRWRHARLEDARGRQVHALTLARRLRVGQVGDWPVRLPLAGGGSIAGRVVAVRLPHALASRAQRRVERRAVRKQHATTDRRTLEAARYVLLFTTLPAEQVDAATVTEIYRFRWQIELAFKRHKQILQIGRLPHKDPAAAQGWILSKLVMALLLERLYRNAVAISPWGHRVEGSSAARSAAA